MAEPFNLSQEEKEALRPIGNVLKKNPHLKKKLKEKVELDPPDHQCPFDNCDGTGFKKEMNEDGEIDTINPCPCEGRTKEEIEEQKQKQKRHLLKHAEVPGRFMGKSLETFEEEKQKEAYTTAIKFVDSWPYPAETGMGLFLYGSSGVGKSHLAISILKKLVTDKNVEGLVAPMTRVVRQLKPHRDQDWRSQREKRLFETELLVLDDLARSRTTDWVTEKIGQIIDERWLEQRPTIITSNYSFDELENFEADSPGWVPIVDRLKEMCKKVIMSGDSYREQQ